jgi:hypothetical protein
MDEEGQLLCGTAEQVHDQLTELSTPYGQGRLDRAISGSWTQSMPSFV